MIRPRRADSHEIALANLRSMLARCDGVVLNAMRVDQIMQFHPLPEQVVRYELQIAKQKAGVA